MVYFTIVDVLTAGMFVGCIGLIGCIICDKLDHINEPKTLSLCSKHTKT